MSWEREMCTVWKCMDTRCAMYTTFPERQQNNDVPHVHLLVILLILSLSQRPPQASL